MGISAQRVVNLSCDECAGTFWVTAMPVTVATAKSSAREAGWTVGQTTKCKLCAFINGRRVFSHVEQNDPDRHFAPDDLIACLLGIGMPTPFSALPDSGKCDCVTPSTQFRRQCPRCDSLDAALGM
ncbi:hypothetical protein [Litorimonas sp. WD9-15]|uniref:hypothetical protein n=1 Tax=Litorimonas sp. WD9-15 TaxID=3418716 RepID=UPI003D07CEAA